MRPTRLALRTGRIGVVIYFPRGLSGSGRCPGSLPADSGHESETGEADSTLDPLRRLQPPLVIRRGHRIGVLVATRPRVPGLSTFPSGGLFAARAAGSSWNQLYPCAELGMQTLHFDTDPGAWLQVGVQTTADSQTLGPAWRPPEKLSMLLYSSSLLLHDLVCSPFLVGSSVWPRGCRFPSRANKSLQRDDIGSGQHPPDLAARIPWLGGRFSLVSKIRSLSVGFCILGRIAGSRGGAGEALRNCVLSSVVLCALRS